MSNNSPQSLRLYKYPCLWFKSRINQMINYKVCKLQDIHGFQILRAKCLKKKSFGIPNHFLISMVFEITVFEIPKFSCNSFLRQIECLKFSSNMNLPLFQHQSTVQQTQFKSFLENALKLLILRNTDASRTQTNFSVKATNSPQQKYKLKSAKNTENSQMN